MKDYKAIWDNLSTTFADAGFNVCCTEDDAGIRANGTHTANFLQQVLQIEPADHVLEIGCGVARIGRELAPYCGEWRGVDIAGNMIAHAKERTKGIPNVFLQELPDNSLRIFPDNSFDCVYSSIVFMHIDKIDMFTYICEAYRVLKPGGRAYFDTYNLLAPEAWQVFLKNVEAFPYGHRPPYMSQFSTPQEMQKFMDEAGFDSVHVDDVNPQLVVALGRKPMPNVTGRASQLQEADARIARLEALIEQQNAGLTENWVYMTKLEAELARKNEALAELTTQLKQREQELIIARQPRLPWKRRKPNR